MAKNKKIYITPEIKRISIFVPVSAFLGMGKTPLCLQTLQTNDKLVSED